jgi:hypothetical protein
VDDAHVRGAVGRLSGRDDLPVVEDLDLRARAHSADREPARTLIEVGEDLRGVELIAALLNLDGIGLSGARVGGRELMGGHEVVGSEFFAGKERDDARPQVGGRFSDVFGDACAGA